MSRLLLLAFIWLISFNGNCKKDTQGPADPPAPVVNEVDFWLTKGDETVLLAKQSTPLSFGTVTNSAPMIDVDSTQKYQSVDGFGYTLTSGSATLLYGLADQTRASLLQELFGTGTNGIGVSYLRLSIGASDLSASVYSYNDMPAGQTDPTLANFSLEVEKASGTKLIPLLKEILQVNPSLKILGSPWSPPVWMKDNGSSIGGSLKPEFYGAYAQYFVKYIKGMAAEGITIDAITPQNEPLHDGNNPSLKMTAIQQLDFIKNHLGPAFRAANINTRIIIWDHNCDNPSYPITILNDPEAKQFIDGSAFHLYNGDISALSTVHQMHPDRNLYFTEQYTASNGSFSGDLVWHMKNVIIGSMRNWSRNALEWNLANDVNFGPHTQGGCTVCKGALTVIGSSSVQRNVSYYIIAQVSKFVPAGSVRIASNNQGGISSAAFLRPDGKKVLVVVNEQANGSAFNIRFKGKWVFASLPGSSAATFIW